MLITWLRLFRNYISSDVEWCEGRIKEFEGFEAQHDCSFLMILPQCLPLQQSSMFTAVYSMKTSSAFSTQLALKQTLNACDLSLQICVHESGCQMKQAWVSHISSVRMKHWCPKSLGNISHVFNLGRKMLNCSSKGINGLWRQNVSVTIHSLIVLHIWNKI